MDSIHYRFGGQRNMNKVLLFILYFYLDSSVAADTAGMNETLPDSAADVGRTSGILPDSEADVGRTSGTLSDYAADVGRTSETLLDSAADAGRRSGTQPGFAADAVETSGTLPDSASDAADASGTQPDFAADAIGKRGILPDSTADAVDTIGALPDFATLCPFSTFCTTSNIKNIEDSSQTSCCQKCSCDPYCHMVGDCCPDVHHAQYTDGIMPRYQCVEPKRLIDVARRFKGNSTYNIRDRYRIIDSCPDTNSSDLYTKCDWPAKLEDYVIVSDTSRGRVFKNKHCAFCHGTEEIVEWKLVAECKEMWTHSFTSFKERDEYILKNCIIDVLPPDQSTSERGMCHRDVISECNKTKNWDVLDESVEEACLKKRPSENVLFKGNAHFFHKGYVTYSNVYCYMCNIKKSQHQELKEKTCEVSQRWDIGKNKGLVSFSAIIQPVHDDREVKARRCKMTELWDKHSGICRHFHCPPGTIPLKGKCEYITTNLKGTNFYVHFHVHLKNGNWTLLQENAYILGQIIIRNIQQPFECGLCWPELYRSKNMSKIMYKFSVSTTEKCSIVDLIEKLKLLIMKGKIKKTLKHNSHKFDITLEASLEDIGDMTHISTDKSLGKYCLFPLKVQLNAFMLQNCPRFEMPIEKLYDAGFANFANKTSADLTVIAVDKEATTVSVCAEKYFELRNSLSQPLYSSNLVIIVSVLLGLVLLSME